MGYVQLTWRHNYELASRKLGVDFVASPKLLLVPEHAAVILVRGMKEGWFTGKKLSDYITLAKSDFTTARRIVNGTDKAKLLASYAEEYDRLLKAAGYGVGKGIAAAVDPVPAEPAEEGSAFKRALISFLKALLGARS